MDRTTVEKAFGPLLKTLGSQCEELELVGDMRMGSPHIREVVLLAVPRWVRRKNLESLFNESVRVNLLDEKLKQLQTEKKLERGQTKGTYRMKRNGVVVTFRLVEVSRQEWITTRFQMSCGRSLQINIATAAKGFGMLWRPEKGGFVIEKTGELLEVESEDDIFKAVNMEVIPMDHRGGEVYFHLAESGLPLPMTEEEVREWLSKRIWVPTRCGGDPHFYTWRTQGDEREFLRVCEFIRAYGYDGSYYGRLWRYLDLDGFCYFDYGCSIHHVNLINKKKLTVPETPWAKNPKSWVDY